MPYQAGTAFVQILPSLKGFHQKIRAELKTINPTVDVKLNPVVDRKSFKVPRIPDQDVKVRAQVDNKSFSQALIHVSQLGRALGSLALPGAMIAATPALASLGASAVAASGALGLLPAAGFAAAGAMGALGVGLAHVGDALGPTGTPAQLKKVNEALAALSPNARSAVQQIRGLGPAWSALRLDVQDRLFAGVTARVKELAGTYLPVLKTELGGIATELNASGQNWAGWLAKARVVGDVQTMFGNVRASMHELIPVATSVSSILTNVGVVGSTFLPNLANWFAEAAAGAAAFVARARETGQLRDWISGGLSVLGDLGQVALNVGSILGSIFQAGTAAGSSFLTTLRTITGEVAAFLNSGQGQSALTSLFAAIRGSVEQLIPGLKAIGTELAQGLIALGPLLPPIAAAISQILINMSPLLGVTTQLALVALPPLTEALRFLAPIGPVLAGGLLLAAGAMKAVALATTIATTATKAWSAITKIASVATKVWAGVQWVLNAALSANPIGIVIVAIGALVAGLIYAWNNSETFRKIVIGAWEGIKTAAVWVWENALKPVIDGLVAGWNAVAAGALWLWNNAIRPAFDFIAQAARVLLAVVVTLVLTPIVLALQAVGAAATWLWQNAIVPAWEGIKTAVSVAWEFLRDSVWNPMVAFLRDTIGVAVMWLWNEVFVPAWEGIKFVVETVWAGLQVVWNALVTFVRDVLGTAIMFLWNQVFVPAWQGIQTVVTTVWTFLRDSIWNPMVTFLRDVLGAAVMFFWNQVIVPAWNGIGTVIRTVWESVIQPVWQAIQTGLDTLKGWFDSTVNAITTIWDKLREATAAPIRFLVNTVWNDGVLRVWNAVAALLPGIDPVEKVTLPFAEGGHVPGVGDTDKVKAVLTPGEFVIRKKVAEPTRDFLEALNRGEPEAVQATGAGRRAFAAGGPVEAGLNFARAQHGKPYIWGGVGPRGYDCSGFMSAITNVLLGRNPHSRVGSTASMPWPGFQAGLNSAFGVGFFKGNPGHTAGTLAGQNVESGGSPSRTKFVAGAAGATHPQFRAHMSLPQVGGQFVGGPGGGGGFVNPIPGWICSAFETILKPIVDRIPGGPPAWLDIPKLLGKKIYDGLLAFALSLAGPESGGAASGVPATGPVADQVRAVAARYGWGSGPEWDALSRIIQKESGWNPNAANPTSSARGLFQKMTSVHGPIEPTPAGQAEWGLNYIRSRYGTPSAALAHHNAKNWYDQGGLAFGRGVMLKSVLGPERVLDPRQTVAFEQLVGAISGARPRQVVSDAQWASRGGAGGGGGPLVGSLSVQAPQGASAQSVIDEAMFAVRHAAHQGRHR